MWPGHVQGAISILIYCVICNLCVAQIVRITTLDTVEFRILGMWQDFITDNYCCDISGFRVCGVVLDGICSVSSTPGTRTSCIFQLIT